MTLRPNWGRTLLLLIIVLGILAIAFKVWTPGVVIADGKDDRGTNGIWMQHGWLGDDGWFERNHRNRSTFRDPSTIAAVAEKLRHHGIRDVFPHLCPCADDGHIASSDPAQVERFLDGFGGFRVMPWIGGVMGVHCFPKSEAWRTAFVSSAAALIELHPRLSGVHVNIEPMPPGAEDCLRLLEELRRALPQGKLVSVAAYPPPTIWHRFPEVHWDEPWFRAVASRSDQLAVMTYDTGLRVPKLFQHLMAGWTRECLDWAGGTPVLIGVPAYDDADSGYHDPKAENLENAFAGVHAALAGRALPENYAGVSVYCEWEMSDEKWAVFVRDFGRH